MTDVGRQLYEREVVRRILELREDLVRHDENLAAYHLLDQCVPYFVKDDPAIAAARRDQRVMVAHILEPDDYIAYYQTNVHERPFEEQYGIPWTEAHEHLPRLRYLLDRLTEIVRGRDSAVTLLDLGANDGFMAADLGVQLDGWLLFDLVDLHPDNIALAHTRRREGAAIDKIWQGNACERGRWTRAAKTAPYDIVIAFELIEHVPDPVVLLERMRECVAPDGRMFVSTPDGAVEQGLLPNWAQVEPKGHVRALREADLRELCSTVGTVEHVFHGADRVMVAEIAPA